MIYLFTFKSIFFYFQLVLLVYWFYNVKKISVFIVINFISLISMNFEILNFQISVAPILLILFSNDELNIQCILKILSDALKILKFILFQSVVLSYIIKNEYCVSY